MDDDKYKIQSYGKVIKVTNEMLVKDEGLKKETKEAKEVEPHKRFIVLAGWYYYPGGGMGDFISSHDTLDEAKDGLNKYKRDESIMDTWGHVYDRHLGKIVYDPDDEC